MSVATSTRARSPSEVISGNFPEPAPETSDWHWNNATWNLMPHHVKEFIMDTPDGFLGLDGLADFWSSPRNISWTRRGVAFRCQRASWHMALNYVRENKLREARAFLLNGAFLHQCQVSTIECIKEWCKSNTPASSAHSTGRAAVVGLEYFAAGVSAAQSLKGIKSHILRYISWNLTDEQRMGYAAHISNDWHDSKKGCRGRLPQVHAIDDGGASIQIIFADDSNQDIRHSFDVRSATTLKKLFNEYAENRGVSLRSLRFSHAGKTLFLSSAGKNTPEGLGMTAGENVIKVHDASAPRAACNKTKSPISREGKSKTKRRKNTNQHKKKQGKQDRQTKIEKAEEEWKNEHSKRLSRMHEELHPDLKRIRQHLNDLVIERSQPKTRSKCHKSKTNAAGLIHSMAENTREPGTGAKAGKSRFVVQVGDAEKLYTTMKPSALWSRSPRPMLSLDLHGCTRRVALTKLDKNLEKWVDMAMQGLYPFVVEVVIICGCGGQLLSETVDDWIKSKKNVCKAPQK